MSSDEKRRDAWVGLDPDAPSSPPSEEEVAESKKLRDALERGDEGDPIAAALKAAWAPEPISASAHAEIIDAMPTAEELALAAMIDDDELVHALRAAWDPAPLSVSEHRAIVDRATAGVVLRLKPKARRLNVAIATTTTVFALAASVIVWITAGPGAKAEVALARSRSTQSLFDEPFKTGESTARIDRIAFARSSDFRANLFAKQGVR